LHTRKLVFKADWRFERFTWADRNVSEWADWHKITGKWTDSKGNVWYRAHWQYFYWENYAVFKISNSGKNYEFVIDPIEYGCPKKIDTETISYWIYFRK